MTRKLTIPLCILLVSSLSLWTGHKIFRYFTHHQKPIFIIKGINEGCAYKGITSCTVKAENSYKIREVRITLDDHPVETEQSKVVKAASFELPFSLDLNNLENGKHCITVEAEDASYNRNKEVKTCEFYVDNTPLKATFLEPAYKVDQGKTLHVKIQANKKLGEAKISFLSKTFNAYPESPNSTLYECFIPIECEDHPNEYVLTANISDEPKNSMQLNASVEIVKFAFKEQHRRGSINVDQEKLNQERELSINEKILDEAIGKWTKNSACEKYWNGPFDIPTQSQRFSTPHGEIRVTPERGRYLHRGIDVVNHPRSVVWASQNGKVVIKDRYFITGNTVVLDHGLGVTTLYAHLEDFADIEVGDMVKKGNKIGRIGMTGYATGYHLHWELRVNNIAVDPIEWTKKIY